MNSNYPKSQKIKLPFLQQKTLKKMKDWPTYKKKYTGLTPQVRFSPI